MTLDHVAIAVHKIKDHLPLYEKALGLRLEGIYRFKEYGVRIASLKLKNARLELIEPMGEKSVLRKFLAQRGEALHHVAFRSRGLVKTVSRLKKKWLKMDQRKTPPWLAR